ncbi:uncharacterized protein LOC112344801 [Selaginella moellendorffii]|uniref:uncharacterized protein LOC112344801 n=1 Tax=Selaginella moellendorffii TaxID=88036 RepID=UPI000D1C61D1|nr:uncharacterized protein LOC112344801 [Selaginella moellendorffii]|eukprot:XP_024525923.1 uncharacterized protein LOC112344801 [Selaginella moellendorffii]
MSVTKSHKLVLVLGSVYANVVVQLERLPLAGETLAARSSSCSAGGRGVNQAACAARLSCPTNLIAQVGNDGHAALVREALASAGVRVDHLSTVSVATGQAVVMMQGVGKTVIVVEGANVSWPRLDGGYGRLQPAAQQNIRAAAVLLLQREIPDAVNIEAAKIAKTAGVPVVLSTGGSESLLPAELLECLTVLSTSDEELARAVALKGDTEDDAVAAARRCIADMGVKQVLLQLRSQGLLLLVTQDEETAVVSAPTSSLGDDIATAAYAVAAFVDAQPHPSALKFAACAALLCNRPGGIAALPDRKAVLDHLVHHSKE